MSRGEPNLFLEAVAVDNTLPIPSRAVELWTRDNRSLLRWAVFPLLRFVFSIQLFGVYFIKRLLPFQFRAHRPLQWTICWFMEKFIRPEANELILRHYTTESNVLNFLIDNMAPEGVTPLQLYPHKIWDMMDASFVDHDQKLFQAIRDMGPVDDSSWPIPHDQLKWTNWRPMEIHPDIQNRKWTQVIDFETSHVLFMSLFCFLLTASEYEAAINGFQFDQSIAIRIAKMVDDPSLMEMAYNKYPLYVVSPWNLTQRFLMHGFFTEFMYEALEKIRLKHHAA